MVAGVWKVFDHDEPTESMTAEWDEVKYVVSGKTTRSPPKWALWDLIKFATHRKAGAEE